MIFSKIFVMTFLLLFLPGCGWVYEFLPSSAQHNPSATKSRMRESALERVAPVVRQDFDRHLPEAMASWTRDREQIDSVPAQFKRRVALLTLKQPWQGLTALEWQGLVAAELAEEGAVNLPGLLDFLEAGVDRTSAFHEAVELPTRPTPDELATFMVESLEKASLHREKAIANLGEEERRFLFDHSRFMVEQFTPQTSSFSVQTIARLKADLRFAELLQHQLDYAHLMAAAQVLARMANEHWLMLLTTSFSQPIPSTQTPPGVTGAVVYVQETSYGLIVIGGSGPNTYELDNRFGLVIDLGGNDHYEGTIASSTDAEHGNAMVIDIEGNDTYAGTPMGLATGRLGVGILIDESGDDMYQLDMGSGGTGFGGLGILFDGKGNDTYIGSRLTQGAAINGFGLLLDESGDDRYTSYGYSIGFGGPVGMGAVIDVRGDDHYQCGNKYPSVYNAEDAPNSKAGDPLFQYDCFGLGTGAGKRVLTKRDDWQRYSLAGGWGLLLDIDGNDHYESANFSLGHGYFFGIGTLLDLDGDDDYQAARYGQGSSAHFGVALFADRHGNDIYGSSGPHYNGGVAWDRSVSLMLDSGNGKDRYHFDASTGLGRADYIGWSCFIDEGGDDHYRVKSGFGKATEKSVSGFFDLKGNDVYQLLERSTVREEEQPSNGKAMKYSTGGLFVDR